MNNATKRNSYFGGRTDDLMEARELRDFRRADWIALALAALDQADLTPHELAVAYNGARGDVTKTVRELDEELEP